MDAICGVLGDCVYDVTETSDGSMQEAAGARAGGAAFDRFDGGELHGGMVAASLVDYPGISECLYEAHVTYANEAKVKYCGVKPETLAAYGAVCEQTAAEMGRRSARKKRRGHRCGRRRALRAPAEGLRKSPSGWSMSRARTKTA